MAGSAEDIAHSVRIGCRLIYDTLGNLISSDQESVVRQTGRVYFLAEALEAQVLRIEHLSQALYEVSRDMKSLPPEISAA